MSIDKLHITTRYSGGTYIARCGLTKLSRTESHHRAAQDLVEQRFGAGYVAMRSVRLGKELRKASFKEWELQVWTIERI